MKERIFYLIRIYVFMVLMLMLAKPAFMLYHHANHPFTFGDVMQVIGHGITLDLSTALYLIIVPFLIILLSIWLWSWKPTPREAWTLSPIPPTWTQTTV